MGTFPLSSPRARISHSYLRESSNNAEVALVETEKMRENITYETGHENCDECVGYLVKAHEMLKFVVSETISTFSAEGDHSGTVRRSSTLN